MSLVVLWQMLLVIAVNQAEHICDSSIHEEAEDIQKTALLTAKRTQACARICIGQQICKTDNTSLEVSIRTCKCHFLNRTVTVLSDKDLSFHDISKEGYRRVQSAVKKCPSGTTCEHSLKTNNISDVTGCFGTPTVENGYIKHTPTESPVGTVLIPTCDAGYMPQGQVICEDNGTWSPSVCVRVSSCNMVKQYQPVSEDGEYWLSLANFDHYTTKIYCHGMSKSSPQEFLSLVSINYGIYPKITNKNCQGEVESLVESCKDEGGEMWFNKIRINITTMEVVIEDRTFAHVKGSKMYVFFGFAYDCYNEHPNSDLNCGTKGKFTIDLRGTGWRVRKDQEWETCGWKPVIEEIDRQMNDTLITLRCGGYSGGCEPKGGLFLSPYNSKLANPTSN